MEALLKVVVLGRAARNTANIKNRQPIGTMFVRLRRKWISSIQISLQMS